jgi:murein DD-endopeptidase MepM/ murein hydrolase activator NlpD
VTVRGSAQSGFYPVRYQGTDGWASADFLSFTAPGPGPGPGPGNTGSGLVWPVSGGAWEITQGYNGFSHYNGSGGYQYYYAIDIARVDRTTAGKPVYAPASGTVRWTERGSGGITIDMGNGYAVAMFHLTVDRKWLAGNAISQGDYIGTVSGAGGEGYVDFPHIHIAVWQTTDGGNWSRVSVPFTGVNAIGGLDMPDIGGRNQWYGTRFNP